MKSINTRYGRENPAPTTKTHPYSTNDIDMYGRGSSRPIYSLGQIIAYFKYESTKQINNSVGAGFSRPCIIKKIFQRNFYEHIIRNEEDYGRIRQYIQQNPLNWPARQCLSVAMAGGENDRNNPKNMI